MPQNGEINEKFGVYKSLCCGAEIVIREGATFPGCPNHRSLTTIWNPLDFEKTQTAEIRKKAKSEPAA